jgi:hypothetical protein
LRRLLKPVDDEGAVGAHDGVEALSVGGPHLLEDRLQRATPDAPPADAEGDPLAVQVHARHRERILTSGLEKPDEDDQLPLHGIGCELAECQL